MRVVTPAVLFLVLTGDMTEGFQLHEPTGQQAEDSASISALTPILRDWIIQSRDEAIADGVRRIPTTVRSILSGYVPDAVLDRVRWRVGGGGQLSLQQNSFYFAGTPAVTLDYVIVFKERTEALDDHELWLHELKHVIQFMEWGLSCWMKIS